jgi:hypothetical protein
MKATVLEIKKGFAALMQEDGTIVKSKSGNLKIGDVINMNEMKIHKKGRFTAFVAAAAMFVMMLGGVAYAYNTPSYYVSFDVNPAIVIQVNIFERVIGTEATNEDAKEVLVGLNLKNKDIKLAITLAVDRVAELGYFNGEDGNILIAATSKDEDKAEELAEKLQDAVEKDIEENDVKAEVTTKVTGYEMVKAAKEIGMTPGKYNIIVNLLGKDAKDYAETSIKDIMKEVKELKKAAKAEDKIGETDETDEISDTDENEGLKDQNDAGTEEKTGKQEEKAPNADVKQNNGTENKPDKTEKSEKPEKPDNPEKPERPENPEKSEKPEKPENPGNTEKPGKPEKPEKSEKPETTKKQ